MVKNACAVLSLMLLCLALVAVPCDAKKPRRNYRSNLKRQQKTFDFFGLNDWSQFRQALRVPAYPTLSSMMSFMDDTSAIDDLRNRITRLEIRQLLITRTLDKLKAERNANPCGTNIDSSDDDVDIMPETEDDTEIVDESSKNVAVTTSPTTSTTTTTTTTATPSTTTTTTTTMRQQEEKAEVPISQAGENDEDTSDKSAETASTTDAVEPSDEATTIPTAIDDSIEDNSVFIRK